MALPSLAEKASVLRAHAGVASGFQPGQREQKSRAWRWKGGDFQKGIAKRAGPTQDFTLSVFSLVLLGLSFVWKFNGFLHVLWISCGELNFIYISTTFLPPWLVCDFFAVFYYRIGFAFCFSSMDGCVSRTFIMTFFIEMPKVLNLTIPIVRGRNFSNSAHVHCLWCLTPRSFSVCDGEVVGISCC